MSTIRMKAVERLVLTDDDARALFYALYRPSKADVAEQKERLERLTEGITLTEDGAIVRDLDLSFLSRKEKNT